MAASRKVELGKGAYDVMRLMIIKTYTDRAQFDFEAEVESLPMLLPVVDYVAGNAAQNRSAVANQITPELELQLGAQGPRPEPLREAILVHTPVDASWLNQVEIYFSIIQITVLTPHDFASLDEVEERPRLYDEPSNWEQRPFEWNLDRTALRTLLAKLEAKRTLACSRSDS